MRREPAFCRAIERFVGRVDQQLPVHRGEKHRHHAEHDADDDRDARVERGMGSQEIADAGDEQRQQYPDQCDAIFEYDGEHRRVVAVLP